MNLSIININFLIFHLKWRGQRLFKIKFFIFLKFPLKQAELGKNYLIKKYIHDEKIIIRK